MIFISAGTQNFPLNRLFKKMDEICTGNISSSEKIFAQIGYSTYIPHNYNYESFLDNSEFEKKIKECDLFITHAGVGNILSGLESGKKIVAFPRLKKFGEHVDNHQLEIADAFYRGGYVLICKDENKLASAIESSRNFEPRKYKTNNRKFISYIEDFLNNDK